MIKVRCPVCDRAMDEVGPAEWPEWPFCSRRCRLIDLGRWMGERYRIPSEEAPEARDDEADVP